MLDAVVKIIVALFALAGVGLTGYLGWKQFSIKRQDEKDAKSVQLQIDKAVKEVEERMQKRLDEVSLARSEEGARRFETHAKSFEEVNKQIVENTKQISELSNITKGVLDSLASMNTVVTVSAESQRNSNYDRLLIVTNKILKSGKMTISDKTNLMQLYKSWKALKGEEPNMDTKYDECMKLNPILDE